MREIFRLPFRARITIYNHRQFLVVSFFNTLLCHSLPRAKNLKKAKGKLYLNLTTPTPTETLRPSEAIGEDTFVPLTIKLLEAPPSRFIAS